MLLTSKKSNEADQKEIKASENTYLIVAGMALANGNDQVYI